ncbi:MAG: urease accessory protein UreF [Eubacteriales bacterium]
MNKNYFLLLQINDSQFPIGSYTQSYGLETYVQKNLVHNGKIAEEWLTAQMTSSLLYSELLPVKQAFLYGKHRDLQKLQELEQLSLASRTATELREASLKLGKRFVKTVEGLSVDFSLDFFKQYQEECAGMISHPVAYAVFCAMADLEENMVLSHYLYSQVSANITNCVKLIPLSQTEGQKIFTQLQKNFPKMLEKLQHLGEEDLFLSCAGLDLRAMEHEKLYSRLYMS